jgi:protocatechuate 3,4-dioxygenase beta subunit
MGSKLLLLLALAAAGVLAFVVISSMSVDPVGTGGGRAVEPEAEEPGIVAPPELDEDPTPAAPVAGAPATLAVLVTDEEQRPLPGASVSTNIDRMPEAASEAVTDGSGRAVIEGLPGGKKVSVRAVGDLTRIPGTEVVELTAGATALAHIVLVEGGAVTGTVLGPGGAPIGVPYRVVVYPAQTAAGLPAWISGRPPAAERSFGAGDRLFAVGGLQPGEYVVQALAEGFLDGRSEAFEVVKGAVRDGVTVTLERGARVSGVVVRGRTGEPVAGAQVALSPSGMITLGGAGGSIRMGGTKGAKTDEMGRFALEGIAPGDYTVTASATDLASGRVENVKVEKGRDANGVMIQLGEGGAIRGTVYGPDGKGVASAAVQISRVNSSVRIYGSFGGNVQADEKGVFHSDHLEPGRYRVRLATGGGSASASVTIVMAGSVGAPQEPKEEPLGPDEVMVYEGQVSTHDILSPRLCSIEGTVTDEAGAPMPGRVRLEALEVEEEPREDNGLRIDVPRFAGTNPRGEFSFQGLLPGRYALHATGAREEVSLVPGATAAVRIVVRPGTIEGRVFAADGTPAQGALMALEPIDRTIGGGLDFLGMSGGGRVRTDGNGAFRIENVAPARYRLVAVHEHLKGESAEFEVRPGERRSGIRIDLRSPTEIRVEVTDREGKPLAGATVMLRDGDRTTQADRTDAEGVATLRALPGTYTLTIRGPAGEQAERELQVGRAATQSVSLQTE